MTENYEGRSLEPPRDFFAAIPQDCDYDDSKTVLASDVSFDIGDEESVSEEERHEATKKAIQIFHDLLSGIKGYAVIASTALYLHGQEDKIEKLQHIIPGDFDAAVFSQSAMDKIIESLSKKGVIFFNRETKKVIVSGNPLQTMPDREAKVLSGSLAIVVGESGQEKIINYPFEFFYRKSRVLPDSLRHSVVSKMGFPVLDLNTALREQYRLNFKLEGRLAETVQKVWDFLVANQKEVLSSEESKTAAAKKLDLKPLEIDRFFRLLEEFESEIKNVDKEEIRQKIIGLLSGGFKVRAEKRWRTLQLIDEITGVGQVDKSKKTVE